MKFKLLLLTVSLLCHSVSSARETPDILSGLRAGHPRLILTAAGWNELRASSTNHTERSAIIGKVITDARKVLKASPLVYKKAGMRLLDVSREAERRVILCSFAYRLTGETIFLDRARQDLLAAAAFTDWNPSHFLDTAEMTAALAIGYDWLYDDLPASERTTIRQAIQEKGINPSLATNSQNWWHTDDSNWNQVCFGGLTLGALAIADEDPAAAREFLTLARKDILHGLKLYAPDGIFPEGPGYWGYGTSYQVMMLSALQTALGTDWDLSAQPGFLVSAAALVEQTGPTGRPFNFSDGEDGVAFDPALFWFAQALHQPGLVYFQNQLLPCKLTNPRPDPESDRFFPLLAAWTGGLPEKIPPPDLPLAWHGDGPNPVGVFRSSWTDTDALFLAFKGGSASINHGHMDAGSFVLEASGVRWASDLGKQDYLSIESKGWTLWSTAQESDRWRVYRLNNFSHNTLTLGGQLHAVKGDARITTFTANSATVDLSEIFSGQAGSVIRSFSVGDHKTVLVRDQIAEAQPDLSVRWQMLTHASISVASGHATLTLDGRELTAKILSPAGANFEITTAQPPEDGVNQPNPNVRILAVNTKVPASGNLTIEIELRPNPPPIK